MNINPKSIIGGIPGLFEDFEFEKEPSLVSSVAGGVLESITSLGQDIAGLEAKTESAESHFPSKGSIEFNKKATEDQTAEKKQKEVSRKQEFFQTLKEEQEKARRAKDILLFEEELNDIASNLPEDEKNELLHYQASYADKSVYQKAELRKKLIEIRKRKEQEQQKTEVPSPAKQANAMDTQFEGGTGKYGTGSANLSSATGAVG